MKFFELIKGLDINYSGPDFEFNNLVSNSLDTGFGDLYLATNYSYLGLSNRHDYIGQAIEKGAKAVIVSEDVDIPENIIKIKVPTTNILEARLFQSFYNNPQNNLFLIGITGTDGKGTSSQITRTLIGDDFAYIGTAGSYFKDTVLPKTNTTPAPHHLYKTMRQFVDLGAKGLILELGAEGKYFHRLDDLKFDIIGYTNWTDPNLDIPSKEPVKRSGEMKINIALENLSEDGRVIANSSIKFLDSLPNPTTYGFKENDSFCVSKYSLSETSTKLTINDIEFQIPLIGSYNVENFCLAYSIAKTFGVKDSSIQKRTKKIDVPGKLSFVKKEGFPFIVFDDADTENAFIQSLSNIKNIYNDSRIIIIYGPNGGRDKEKYDKIGKIINNYVDFIFITYYSPKDDDPLVLAQNLANNIDKSKYEIELSRENAIKKAFNLACESDVIIVETTIENPIHYEKGKKIIIDDKKIVDNILNS